MEYQIMEEFDEDTQVYGDTPGGDMHMMNQQEMPVERKLQLAERANEIYREQVKYLQEHLNNIRALVQDKESIIENLMLRYDLGILLQDPSRTENVSSDRIEDKELRRKAEALAQRTILENFELRELVNELRDENFHLRNEIYDLQDRLNRQALHISKMTKNAQNQPNQYITQPNYEMNDYAIMNGNHPEALNDEAQRKREERAEKHKRQQSSMAQPQDFWDSGINPEEDPETDEEKPRKVARNTGDEDDAREQEQDQENNYMDEAAKKKHQERQEKAHEKKESAAVPDQFFEDDYSPDKAANGNSNDRPNKRRGSKQLDGDPTQTEEAKAKRQERQEKAKGRQDSVAAPTGMFEVDYANTEEAKRIREERAKKIRKESIALPKSFLNAEDPNASEDDASREKRRKHQRKQSLMKAVGDKGHLSDEDTEKTQHVDYETRKKSGLVDRSRQKGKEAGASDDPNKTTHHRRESSMPIPDLKFEDPNTLLAMAQDEVKELKQKLTNTEQEKKTIEKQLQDNKKETEQLEQKLSQQLEQKITQQVEKRLEEKFQKEKTGLLATNKKDMDQLNIRLDDLKNQLTQAATSKVTLIECTSHEINRLNRVINGLLQSERCKEITRLILEDNGKQT